MKNSFDYLLLFFGMAVFGLCGCTVSAHTEKVTGVNFADYKSFGWAANADEKSGKNSVGDIVDNNIRNEASGQLEKKGLQQVTSNPDMLLDYRISVHHATKRDSRPAYSYASFSPFGYIGRGRFEGFIQPSIYRGYRSANVRVNETMLVMSLMDAKTGKLIWQGWREAGANGHAITSKQATSDVKAILHKLNYHS